MSPLKATQDQEQTGDPRAGRLEGSAHTEAPLCVWCQRMVSDLARAPAVHLQTFSSLPGAVGGCPLMKGQGGWSAGWTNKRKWKLFGERRL